MAQVAFKVSFVGPPKSGKTTLVKKLLRSRGDVQPMNPTASAVKGGVFKTQGQDLVSVQFWDNTSDITQIKSYVKYASIIVVCF